ncbi:MAG TPA: DUF3160 domain-containing protein [Polyangiales bacterium]|nr:DUF3160 domain-containing protein [Polyangiales bacterium]
MRLALFALPCLLACSQSTPRAPTEMPGGPEDTVEPVSVSVKPLAADQAAFDALREQLGAAKKLDAAGLRAKYPVNFRALGFDPTTAAGLDVIAGSRFALTEAERAKLGEHGFVISTRNSFPTFTYGLAQLYSEHLPLYVSADSLLESVHASYDKILESIERNLLEPELKLLFDGMRSRLATLSADESVKKDLDVYLAVADALIRQSAPRMVAGGDAALAQQLVALANDAKQGVTQVELFGVKRKEDFSQFKPRGHYTNGLEHYFRTMIWLGRFDFRLLETIEGGKQVFRRPQYLATLAVRELMAEDVSHYEAVDDTIRTFVGESDYMAPSEVDKLVAALGADAASASDQQVVDAIIAGGYGKQNLLSTIAPADVEGKVLPLNRSFALLGQRYVVDSHVFSDVVDDRVSRRMLPNPLDAAFAALKNDKALAVHPELETKGLAGALAAARVGVEAHDSAFWSANLYNLWLTALQGLSTAPDNVPALMGTEAWSRRILNTQLGSWAELRHDTVLYAKQSYSGTPACEFPDAYVDPYPAFWQALQKYADAGARVAKLFPASESNLPALVATYFDNLKRATTTLGDMVDRELRGEPFSAEQLQFINDAVRIQRESKGCFSVDVPDGWYADLFFVKDESLEFDPTIADVHTAPYDRTGSEVGNVLHVGTSYPRLMVATVDTCNGPRAYAGLVYAYHEKITEDFERLTDDEWAAQIKSGPAPADVPWMADLLAN